MSMYTSWLAVALTGIVGLPLAAQAGGRCGEGPKGCWFENNAVRSADVGRSSASTASRRQEQTAALAAGLPVGQGNPGIAPINSRINTIKTYAELGAEWWQWAVQAPAADSPLFDTTGEKCRVGQQGPVWFLAGTLGSSEPVTRQCDIPGGKAIFFPVINNAYFGFINDPPETRTAEFVRATVENGCDSKSIRNLSVMIDGRAIARPARFVTTADQSPLFQAQLPTDNVFGAIAAEDPANPNALVIQDLLLSPSAHKGFYLYLEPLRPGSHTIEWTATWDCSFGAFSENIKYNLTVLTGVAGEVE
jgi:hypothetical protein